MNRERVLKQKIAEVKEKEFALYTERKILEAELKELVSSRVKSEKIEQKESTRNKCIFILQKREEGVSFKDIAKLLDLSEGRVRQLHCRAINRQRRGVL